MNIYVKYLLITGILMVLDVAWIAMNVSAYSSVILNVQKSPVSLRTDYAIIAYLFILFSVIYVAIPFTTQSIKKGDSIRSISIETKLLKSFIYGGAVGFSIYGIYNFTSLAIYKDLDNTMGIIDTLWGTALYTITTFVFLLLPD